MILDYYRQPSLSHHLRVLPGEFFQQNTALLLKLKVWLHHYGWSWNLMYMFMCLFVEDLRTQIITSILCPHLVNLFGHPHFSVDERISVILHVTKYWYRDISHWANILCYLLVIMVLIISNICLRLENHHGSLCLVVDVLCITIQYKWR
jgi:hypothetical protein